MEAILSKEDYREFTQRVDIASTKGINVPHLVEKVGEKFKITLLEKIDLDMLDEITGSQ